MEPIENFVNNPEIAENLYGKLRERVFLKTELDVVYTDLVNWERSGLLSIGGDSNKGDWKKVNYTEYIWIKIIVELRNYGFNYDEIELIKQGLFEEITIGQFMQSVTEDKENFIEKLGDEPFNKLNAFDLNHIDLNESAEITYLDTIVVNAIAANEDWSLLFIKDIPGACIPMSAESLRGFHLKNTTNELSSLLTQTYLSVSLSRITDNFLKRGNDNFESRTISILTKEEHAVLKHIRKKQKNLTCDYRMEISILLSFYLRKRVFLEIRLLMNL